MRPSSSAAPTTSPTSCIPRLSSCSARIGMHAGHSNASASTTPGKSSAASSTRPMAVLRTRRRKILAAIAAVLLGAVGYCFGYEPRYTGSLVPPPSQPLVFAHRGFGNYGPDNSLYAVNKALDTGMDGVDMDGQLTSDGEIVIFHDLSVDRLTAGTGRVRGKTTKEMLALDLGPKYNPAIHGANVHTFEDFVREVK